MTEPHGNRARVTGLSASTELSGEGPFAGVLDGAWSAFGVNGGYMAAYALRAVGRVASLTVPVSAAIHYLRPGQPDAAVTLEPRLLRPSSQSESLTVDMTQDGKQVLVGLVRNTEKREFVDAAPVGAPIVPPPDNLLPWVQLVPRERIEGMPIARHLDVRPVTWSSGWPPRNVEPARYICWARFLEEGQVADPYVAAGQLAVLADSFVWPAAERVFTSGPPAPVRTLDLALTFTGRSATGGDWLLVDAEVQSMHGGLITGRCRVFDHDKRLLADSVTTMTFVG